tara:strand:- start:34 stop:312 length:279 start_codon:yes stop_codon:yes gene_type:complete
MWKDKIKKEKKDDGSTGKTGDTMEISASNMHSPANRDLKNEAMSKILQNVYSAPELESLLIDMMNKINRSIKGINKKSKKSKKYWVGGSRSY